MVPRLYGSIFNGLAYIAPPLAAKMAFSTFCKVRKGRVLPEQAGFLDLAIKDRERLAGHDIQTYHWEGPGETVLLIHGWESNSFRWRKLIGYLRDRDFNIYAFDAPAHGYSSGTYLHIPLYSDCVLGIIRKYQPRHVVAHSIGGMTTLYSLFRQPENGIEKIVTIGSPSEFHEIMAHYRQLLHLNTRMMEAMDAFVIDKFGFAIRDFSSSRFARAINSKGLIFHDRQDTVAPFHASEEVHGHWPGSQLVATEGLGHSMHQEEVNKKILEFLIS